MFGNFRSRLLPALLVSVASHAILLISVASVVSPLPDLPPASVRVVLSGTRASNQILRPKSAAVSSGAVPPSGAERPSSSRSVRKTAERLVEKAAPVRALVSPGSEAEAFRPAPASEQSAIVPRPSEVVNPDELRHYRLSLAIAARHFKQYPALARERGWEGVAEVAIDIRGHLQPVEVLLLSSSGFAILDAQALELVGRASQSTELPESFKRGNFRIVLPVRFGLESDQ